VVVRNQRYMAKWTLRALSLKAVIEYRAIFRRVRPSCRVQNLRECLFILSENCGRDFK
jgi:hypothetical protein